NDVGQPVPARVARRIFYTSQVAKYLGIFGTSDKAQRVVPNKAYQGMAAGLALITSDTAPQRDMLGDAASYVPAGDASALADMLESFAADPDAITAARTRASERADNAFHPAHVVRPLLAALDLEPGRRGTGAATRHAKEKSPR
ncbi:glycosyltransferase, partial [Actinotignum timonense]|uniref:glycosyltransferase n=1 Tax=Actinotignum timonense TaxID=1870995 RepID=UPI002A7FDAEE